MGQSTNAILAFGFPLDEEITYPWQDDTYDNDFESWLATMLGCPEPKLPYNEENQLIYSKYWDDKAALIKDVKVELDTHCSADYAMYFLAIKGTITNAYRGSPELITTPLTQPNEEILLEFCKKYNIPAQKPKWWLYSYWC